MYTKPTPKTDLEKIFFEDIERETPDRIRNNPVIDITNENEYTIRLKKEHLYKNIDDKSVLTTNEIRTTEGLGLYDWFKTYEKEAKVSTAGIRGLQNPLYPWDTRYPLNVFGIILATLGKALVVKDKYPNSIQNIVKLASCEVRYNSDLYVDLISRVQAAQGIRTVRTLEGKTIPIWMASFLIFTNDLYGGEYVTSSHAVSKKIATKDINFQGSQYIPEETALFVEKIRELIKKIETDGYLDIEIASINHPLIDTKYFEDNKYGIPQYTDYLKTSIATKENIDLIKSKKNKIVIECMGGSMHEPLSAIFENLGIEDKFDFTNTAHDPFFHGIGKTYVNEKFDDLGCDSTIIKIKKEDGFMSLPVVGTMNYQEKLKNYPIGTVVLMTDPDGDRLVTAQVETKDRIQSLEKLGVMHFSLDENRILVVYMPNQSFLMNIDFQMKSLKRAGLWDQYNWFIIKTTPSAMSWDEWAKYNAVPVINTPVGFKEIATIMQKVEKKIIETTNEDIYVKDIFGTPVNLGQKPRLLFAGEESGGEIFGPSEIIKSKKGKIAISMREKSAGEAILISSAMIADLEKRNAYLSDYLLEIFDQNKILGRYDIRIDKKYYNESEPDIVKLRQSKEDGISIRTANDMFFVSIALMARLNGLSIELVKEILIEAFPLLNFSDLLEINFVGDGTYLRFKTKYVEVRPSGTDAINKAYSAGSNRSESVIYADTFASYDGKRTSMYKRYIPDDFYNNVKDLAMKILMQYQKEDLPETKYE